MRGSYYLMDGLALDLSNMTDWESLVPLPALTPQACIDRCVLDGYSYAGLMSGDTCVCDDSYDLYGEHIQRTLNVLQAAMAAPSQPRGRLPRYCSCGNCLRRGKRADLCACSSSRSTANCTFTKAEWNCGGRVSESNDPCGGASGGRIRCANSVIGCYEENEQNAVALVRLRDAESYAKTAVSLFRSGSRTTIARTPTPLENGSRSIIMVTRCDVARWFCRHLLACDWATSIRGRT